VPPAPSAEQRAALERLRRDRDAPRVHAALDALKAAASGGDDYEILCTIPESSLAALQAAARAAGIEATAIGAIREGGDPPRFIAAGGRVVTLKRGSYSHF